jgi:hypothetical protein
MSMRFPAVADAAADRPADGAPAVLGFVPHVTVDDDHAAESFRAAI